jgi:superfamily II DNA or RNA helicase
MNGRPSLALLLRSQCDPRVQARGEEYFQENRVRDIEGGPDFVAATVRGSRDYNVSLDLDGDRLEGDCDCPYFQDWGQCKHIWAVVVAADQNNHLSEAAKHPALRLVRSLQETDNDDDEIDDFGTPFARAMARLLVGGRAPAGPAHRSPPREDWQGILAKINGAIVNRAESENTKPRQFHYEFSQTNTLEHGSLCLSVLASTPTKKGGWTKPRALRLYSLRICDITEVVDRDIVIALKGYQADSAQSHSGMGYNHFGYSSTLTALNPGQALHMLPLMCSTRRAILRIEKDDDVVGPLDCRTENPFRLELEVAEVAGGKSLRLAASLRRDSERRDLTEPAMLIAGGWVFWRDGSIDPLRDEGVFPWIAALRKTGPIEVPARDADQLLKQCFGMRVAPRLHLPDSLRVEEVRVPPRPCLRIIARKKAQDFIHASLSFFYGDTELDAGKDGSNYDAKERRFIVRDPAAEALANQTLRALGASTQPVLYYGINPKAPWVLPTRKVPAIVGKLIENRWRVEAEGKLYRQASALRLNLTSGVDWFELHGTAQFDGQEVPIPSLLAALRKGENTITLSDGTIGVLPPEWLAKYASLAGLGDPAGETVRFSRKQAGLLDALLAARPEMTCDATFARIREELRTFENVQPITPESGFTGELRPYQREGLGWLHFLQRFGLGGCLADDMGLGKTVQVLALLESRRHLRTQPGGEDVGPSLVVVPRSLMFNWVQEARRFTPAMRVLEHSGLTRMREGGEHFSAYDLVLTTYGTLRRDIAILKDIVFDYVILDEAQAIKNAETDSSKAVRLMQSRHRLAMSGTPVENHVGELWSLFEFLNPGMLGAASVFKAISTHRGVDDDMLPLLRRALRPYILRRTKSQVAKDLPERTEETLYCELDAQQRRLYNELRDYYRDNLLARIARDGIKKAGIHVLEALLRLRQAACHPGLMDKTKVSDSSAKLDTLIPQVQEVIEEDHKVLVFSQFTSLLAIVKSRFDQAGVVYEYLDGKTTDREARVSRFQTDPACKLFLISLKAGGLGLNLTAAEYVYLLDPWWNPAVEAQAIDRTHRIGQTRPVFAYRLIARDTVEERVLALQKTKRDLADAIISENNSTLRSLTREDVELLLA